MKFSTSTCLFLMHRDHKTRSSIIECMDMMKECGWDTVDANFCNATKPESRVEITLDDWEAKMYEIRDHAEKIGMTFDQSHVPFAEIAVKGKSLDAEQRAAFDEATRRSIIASGILGVKWIVAHAITDNINDEWDTETNIKTNYEFFAPQVELAKKSGCGIAIENMAEFDPKALKRRFTAAVDEQIALIDRFADSSVGACWDFGHAELMYRDQAPALRKLGKRLKATHVQDNPGTYDAHLIPYCGGYVQWDKLMGVLVDIGYEGDFVYECHGFMTNFPDELRIPAGKFAYEVGMNVVGIYERLKAQNG